MFTRKILGINRYVCMLMNLRDDDVTYQPSGCQANVGDNFVYLFIYLHELNQFLWAVYIKYINSSKAQLNLYIYIYVYT